MGYKAQCIHLVPVDKQVHLHKVGGSVVGKLIVQGCIALGAGLESIEKVIDYLVQRHIVMHFHKTAVQILHVLVYAAPVLAERHDIPHKFIGSYDGGLHIGLICFLNGDRIGVVVGVIHHDCAAVCLHHFIYNGGQRRHKLQVKLPLKPLLNHLHVEHAQKTAAEAEAQGR